MMQHLKKSFLSSIIILFVCTVCAENLYAQFFAFGKNRVQYESFDWRFIETEHFDIHYYNAKNYHLAQFTAEALEPSIKQLKEDFGDELTNRIPVIIYDSHSDFSQTNVVNLPGFGQGIGGVTDKLKNRMTQPFMGDYADFRRTLQHELAHAVINDIYYGGSVQSMLQNNIQLRFPLWFEEGLAEFLALGWDTQTDMFIRDAILNSYLPPLTQLSGFFAYRGGQSFWFYIQETYGRQKITEILQRIKTTRNIQQSLMQSLGLQLDELSDRWHEFLRRRYFPEVSDRQTTGSVATQITNRNNAGTLNTSPSISPRGDRIAMLSSRRGVIDVDVVDANSGERLKTLVKGASNPSFEEIDFLNPNLSWSPDGSKIVVASQSQGTHTLAIIDYESTKADIIKFPSMDGIYSTSWSPDGKKIAFDGNIGPYQDIFVYNLETGDFENLTNDVFTNKEPAWSPDSETLYFVSNRGDYLEVNSALAGYSTMKDDQFFQTDLYSIRLNSKRIQRLTNTPNWSEIQPDVTAEGRLVYVSDQSGIPNIYEYDLRSRMSYPLTNLQSGVMQISISEDGTRLAFNSLNSGFRDIYLIRSPFSRKMDQQLKQNSWAQERERISPGQRVPAIGYTQDMIHNRQFGNAISSRITQPAQQPDNDPQNVNLNGDEENGEGRDRRDEKEDEQEDNGRIDFRNYQFGEEVLRDSTIELRDDPKKFEPETNLTDDGLYQPKKYRLQFTPDISAAAGQLSTFFGTSAFAFVTLSDLMGDHQLSFGSNLVFDLRNSDYSFQYAYLKNRTNFFAGFFHQARNFQTFTGDLLRFRTFGGSIDFQYPLSRFRRVDYGISAIGISRDFSSIQAFGEEFTDNENSFFLFPQATFTADYTLPGFITPRGGTRYSVRLSASPPLGSDTPQFATLMGDFRQYVNLGNRYTIALRGSGAFSEGRDSQTFFMGGMLGWINQQWSNAEIPFDRLADTFFTVPATPLRGHEFNTIFGDRFSLINAEFRFPMFAAVLPGPVPILPLWNLTGVAFLDAGAAWGFDVPFSRFNDIETGDPIIYFENPSELNGVVGTKREVIIDGNPSSPNFGLIKDGPPEAGDVSATFVDGDILIGGGFGVRTILLGLPFRYDIGWPYERDGFGGSPIHYFSIGIDF